MTHLDYSKNKVSVRYRQCIAAVTLAGLESSDLWVFYPDSARDKNSLLLLSTTYGYFRLLIGPRNSLKLRFCLHS